MANNIFKGMGVALATPFKKDGTIDENALRRLVCYQQDNGADFFCILATTGETPCLSSEEKNYIKNTVVELTKGRIPILMGLGGNNTATVVEELKTTDLEGIDGILSVCPYYNKPSQEGLYQHFCAVAKASPVPVILYNVPGRTGVNLLPETVIRIYNAHPDKIIGIKEASGNIEQIKRLIALSQESRVKSQDPLLVISGDDGIACEVMEAGGAGLISVASNAFPKDFWHIVHDKDRALQAKYAEMVRLLFAEGNPVGIKAVLAQKGIIQNYLRLPLVPASKELQNKITQELAYIKKKQ